MLWRARTGSRGGAARRCYPDRVTSPGPPRRVDPLLLVVAFVTLLLLGLGFLQYRWTGELSEAERTRLHAGLKMRAEALGQDVDREVTRAFLRLQLDPATVRDRNFASYAERYERWRTVATEPSLVKEVYFVDGGEGSGETLRLSRYRPDLKTFEATEWPASLAAARDRILAVPSPAPPARGFRFGPVSLLDDGTPVLLAPAPSFERGPSPGRGPSLERGATTERGPGPGRGSWAGGGVLSGNGPGESSPSA